MLFTHSLFKGMIGPEIGLLHQYLLELGLTISAQDLSTMDFGNSTEESIKTFQKNHCDEKGLPLMADGVIGPKTMWALEHQQANHPINTAPGWRYRSNLVTPILRPVTDIAVSQIGRQEDPPGSNRGPDIDKYGNDGQPWCAYFVSWCYQHFYSGSPFGTLTSALKLKTWGEQNKALLGNGEWVIPGDIGIFIRGDLHGHCELIIGISDDALSTFNVGGNVSNGVRGTVRPIKSWMAIIRPVKHVT